MFGLITVLYEKKESRYARICHIKRTLAERAFAACACKAAWKNR